MKCGWCGKTDCQVDLLIAGPKAYICNLCVARLTPTGTENVSTKLEAEGNCSFCAANQPVFESKLIHTKGVRICKICLNQCEEIIDESSDRNTRGGNSDEQDPPDDHTDCECKKRQPSALEEEWSNLVFEAEDDNELIKNGRIWLRKNGTDEAAGEAIARLLAIKSTPGLITLGEAWLDRYPQHDSSAAVIGELLKAARSPKIIRLAGKYLKGSANVSQARPIIRALIEGPRHAGLQKKIADLLEKYPHDEGWRDALLSTSRHVRQQSENLAARWLQLNVDDSQLFNTHIYLTRSPEVIEATFDWMRSGGQTSKYLSSTLDSAISAAARYHRAILPSVLRFSRAWLKANPEHEGAGKVYAAVLSATASKTDINSAKKWYTTHLTSERSYFIISNILDLSYWGRANVDEYAVNEARRLLATKPVTSNMARLIGALVSVRPDENSIAMAKELYDSHSLLWILMRLLIRAPDPETIAKAELAYSRWKDHAELEPEMLYALLRADPRNKLALRRTKLWSKRDPSNRWIKAIKPLIQRGYS